jgi:hypothetical protein
MRYAFAYSLEYFYDYVDIWNVDIPTILLSYYPTILLSYNPTILKNELAHRPTWLPKLPPTGKVVGW